MYDLCVCISYTHLPGDIQYRSLEGVKAASAPTGKCSLPCEGVAWSVPEQSVPLLLLLRDPVTAWTRFASLLRGFSLAVGSFLPSFCLAWACFCLAVGSLCLALACFCLALWVLTSVCVFCVFSVFWLSLHCLCICPPPPNLLSRSAWLYGSFR